MADTKWLDEIRKTAEEQYKIDAGLDKQDEPKKAEKKAPKKAEKKDK